jgi:hypothetical protein
MVVLWLTVVALFIHLVDCDNIIYLNATSENVTSPQFLARANKIYEKILDCIEHGRPGVIANRSIYKFPLDAENHYRELYERTAHMRKADMHYYAGYDGPWIENHWIQTFQRLPLSAFGGLIPIFAQWIDIEIRSHRDYNHKRDELMQMIRPTVLYVALSQGDLGLGNLPLRAPNILVLSAGGYGHIPIPLIRGHISYYPINSAFKYNVSFFGSFQHGRDRMFHIIEEVSKAKNFTTLIQSYGNHWHNVLLETRFNLAPRGYGRSSFRFTE